MYSFCGKYKIKKQNILRKFEITQTILTTDNYF